MTKNDNSVVQPVKPFYNSLNLPPKPTISSSKPSKVQESPLDAKSPQEVLKQHGMYKEDSAYSKHPELIHADLTQFGDYESNLNAIRRMKEKFNCLDIDVRARFNHDVNEFTKYINSSDFDINKVLTEKEQKKYADYKAKQQKQAEYQSYLQSDEYKAEIQAHAQRQAYEQAKYEEWLASQQKGIK